MSVEGEGSVGSDLGVSASDGNVDFSGLDSLETGNDFGELSAGSEAPGGNASVETTPAKTDTQSSTTPAPTAPDGEGVGKQEAKPVEAPNPATQQPNATQTPSPSQPKPEAASQAQTPADAAQASELDKFLSDITQNEAAFVDHLAQSSFKLSPEMVQALADGQGETMIPKIVAGGALWAVKSMTNIFKQTIPAIIEKEVARITEQQTLRKTAEDKFFAKWPQLSREQHFQDIQQISHALRAANPTIGFDDLVALTGAAVAAKHGIVAQPAVQTPAKPNGAFVPAAGARVVAQTPVDQNPFAGMAQDFDD